MGKYGRNERIGPSGSGQKATAEDSEGRFVGWTFFGLPIDVNAPATSTHDPASENAGEEASED